MFNFKLKHYFLLPCKHCNSFSMCKCSCCFFFVFMLFASCVHLHAVTTGFLWTTFQHTLHFASLCRYKYLLHCQPMHNERDIFCNTVFFFVNHLCCISPKWISISGLLLHTTRILACIKTISTSVMPALNVSYMIQQSQPLSLQ